MRHREPLPAHRYASATLDHWESVARPRTRLTSTLSGPRAFQGLKRRVVFWADAPYCFLPGVIRLGAVGSLHPSRGCRTIVRAAGRSGRVARDYRFAGTVKPCCGLSH